MIVIIEIGDCLTVNVKHLEVNQQYTFLNEKLELLLESKNKTTKNDQLTGPII